MNTEVLIKVENLQKQFDDNMVLDGISTEIHKGKLWLLSVLPALENLLFKVAESSGEAYRGKDFL